jgi:hypothetical protein
MGDKAMMNGTLQRFSDYQQAAQKGANFVPSGQMPSAGWQMPSTGGLEPMPPQPMMPRTGGLEPLPQQQAMGASIPGHQGPLQAQTVLQALNAGAQPRATGRGYGWRK